MQRSRQQKRQLVARRRRRLGPGQGALFATLALLVLCSAEAVRSQSFTLDDSPAAPVIGPAGAGCGAENQYGLPTGTCPPGLAPSPTLASLLPLRGSGSILTPGPVAALSPNGESLDGLSSNHAAVAGTPVLLRFSVDRLSSGLAGSGVALQASRNQQAADVFEGPSFADPGSFAGSLGPGPFSGALSAFVGGSSNRLAIDESSLGLLAGGSLVDAATTAAPATSASHDNLDAYDDATLDADGDGLFDAFAYFSVNPDEALLVGRSAADLFDVAPDTAVTEPTPFATAASLGLDSAGPGSDSIDALVVFDHDALGGTDDGGPGAQPGTDYALFSLAPGSASLASFSLSAGDVLFSDFSGAFALYASASELGLDRTTGGAPGGGDNVDALELRAVPPVPSASESGLALLALLLSVAGACRLAGFVATCRRRGGRAPG